jgi:hypothetical protein
MLCTCNKLEVLWPEADPRPRPSLHTQNRDIDRGSGQAAQCHIWTIWSMDRTTARTQVYLNLLRSNSLQFKSLAGERTQLWRQQRKLWASSYVPHYNNNIPPHTLFLLILPEYNTSTISPHSFMSFSKLYCWRAWHRMEEVRDRAINKHPTSRSQQQQSPTATLDRQQSALDKWQIPTDIHPTVENQHLTANS